MNLLLFTWPFSHGPDINRIWFNKTKCWQTGNLMMLNTSGAAMIYDGVFSKNLPPIWVHMPSSNCVWCLIIFMLDIFFFLSLNFFEMRVDTFCHLIIWVWIAAFKLCFFFNNCKHVNLFWKCIELLIDSAIISSVVPTESQQNEISCAGKCNEEKVIKLKSISVFIFNLRSHNKTIDFYCQQKREIQQMPLKVLAL